MRKNIDWLKLDTAGNLYPAIESLRYPGMYRLNAVMHKPADPEKLTEATEAVLDRFPALKVRLRRGLFWFYLEPNPRPPLIREDSSYPGTRIVRSQNNDYLFRILYRDCTISLDVFHAAADGYGALVFLKTILAEYLRRFGILVPYEAGILDPSEDPDPEEFENAFIRYYRGKLRRPVKEPRVYHLRGTRLPHEGLTVITGEISLSVLLKKTREQRVSITEYISAVLIFSLYQLQERTQSPRRKKAIRLSVPVNLRSMFPSKTLRNFSQFIKPGINPDLGDYTFEEVLHQVHHAIRYEKSEKYLSAVWSEHVALELNPVIRAVPLVFKNLVMNIIFNYFGENRFSGTFSNLGSVELPPVMQEQISHFDLYLGPNPINPVNCSAITCGDKLRISFSRTIREKDLEQLFFTHFVREGIPVTIDTDTASGI
jgi:hypothetical protein